MVQIEELKEFMIMLLILPRLLVFSQPVWVLTLMFQKSIALTEKLQSAMVREQMEFQMLVAHHLFQFAMVYQERTDTQVLTVLLLLSQHVVQNMEDYQELTVKLDMEVISQHQLEHQV
jgi:hypothetical protein